MAQPILVTPVNQNAADEFSFVWTLEDNDEVMWRVGGLPSIEHNLCGGV